LLSVNERSKNYSQFVELLFVVVLALGVETRARLFQHPYATYLLVNFVPLATLMVSFFVIAVSWVYYHRSVQSLPYLRSNWTWIRFLLDSLIALSYTGLVLSVDSIRDFGLVLAVIYFMYCIHGFSTVLEHGWFNPKTLKPNSVPMFWALFSVYFIAIAYLPWSLFDSLSGFQLGNLLALVAYFVGIFASRYLRHGKYELLTTSALRKLKLQRTPTVALDVDGVLADQVPHVLARANPEKHLNMTKSDITEWDTMVGDERFTDLILRYLKEPKFVASMPEMEGAKGPIETMRMRANIKVASSRPYETQVDTEGWLRSKFQFDGVEFVNTTNSGKAATDADMLIDDNIDNITSFVTAKRRKWDNLLARRKYGILLLQPWNEKKIGRIQSLVEDRRIIIAKEWREIESWLA